jgi:nanoRNase/pAp phosphatase (c-di-AMP/oligoRNAs hydrolase)
MPSRLVVGSGSTVRALISAVSDQGDPVTVVTDDDRWTESLHGNGVSVTTVDDFDQVTVSTIDSAPDTVVVATPDAEMNIHIATQVRSQFPDALLLCTTANATDAQQSTLTEISDRTVDPMSSVTDRLFRVLGEDGIRVRRLQKVLRSIDGHLAVVMHDNPDPDAIASAVALGALAKRVGCTVSVCYYGTISHQENRAFANLLSYDLVNLDPDDPDALDAYDGFALVDHSRPGVNDQLPADLPIDIVIDHHPPQHPVEARYVDLRSGVGATSTLLVDHFRRLGIDIPEQIATGLLFGIRVDTNEFQREVSAEDFTAAAHLITRADMGVLQQIEDPSISPDTLGTIGRAITNRRTEGSIILSCVGQLSNRDALAQAADRLLDLEGIQATMVYGVLDGMIYISARARGADIELGDVLRDAFGQIGSAGGHADMAGAQIELGVLEIVDDEDESLHAVVQSVIDSRFLDAVTNRSNQLLSRVYGDDEMEFVRPRFDDDLS